MRQRAPFATRSPKVAKRNFGRELHANGIFGEGACQKKVLVDGSNEQLECCGEFSRVAVPNQIRQVRTKRRQNFAFTKLKPAAHAEQYVGFPSKCEGRGVLKDLEGDVLRNVLMNE